MNRLVPAQPRGARAFSGNTNQSVKDYLDRVARYVPAEILAAYLTLVPVVTGTTKDTPGLQRGLLALVLFGLGLLNIPYLMRVAEAGQPKFKHIIASTVAYAVWTYSIGGSGRSLASTMKQSLQF